MHHFGAVAPQVHIHCITATAATFWCCGPQVHIHCITTTAATFGAANIDERIMAEIKRAISSWRVYRAHLNKLLQSVDECLSTTTPLTANQTATMRDHTSNLSVRTLL